MNRSRPARTLAAVTVTLAFGAALTGCGARATSLPARPPAPDSSTRGEAAPVAAAPVPADQVAEHVLADARVDGIAGTGGRYVVGRPGGRGVVVDPDGTTRPITRGAVRRPRAGDVVRWWRDRMVVVDPTTARQWALPLPPGAQRWYVATLDEHGGVWGFAADTTADAGVPRVRLWHSRDAATWSSIVLSKGAPTMAGRVATGGGHVAALGSYDGATVAPVGDLAVSSDGGRTWTHLGRDDVPFEYVDTMVATDDGTLFVLGGQLGGGPGTFPSVYRSADDAWTDFEEVDLGDGVSAGRLVDSPGAAIAVVGRGSGDLRTIEPDGTVRLVTDPLR